MVLHVYRCIHIKVRTTTELELKGDYTLEIAEASIHREAWLPDGYRRIFRLYVLGPSGF